MTILYPALLLITLWVCIFVHYSSSFNWQMVSDVGVYGLVATAVAFPVLQGEWGDFKFAGYIIAIASGIGLLGKMLIDAKRPDKSGNDSFPSNHTANAFAASTVLAMSYGWIIGLLSYGMAMLVGLGRVKALKHHWRDVIVGLCVGLSTAVFAVAWL
ncbi:phosphatase PAP2 family protein [Enterovibrio sp. Hal110]